MSIAIKTETGSILWRDLTVNNADEIKDFYCKVVGWKADAHDMEDYNDYDIMLPESGEVVTGICHARGINANIPPQWLIYIAVESIEKSIRKCLDLGGKVLDGPRMMGEFWSCIIQDPAGAVAALISNKQ